MLVERKAGLYLALLPFFFGICDFSSQAFNIVGGDG